MQNNIGNLYEMSQDIMTKAVDAYDEVAESAELNINVQDSHAETSIDVSGGLEFLSNRVKGTAQSYVIFSQLNARSKSISEKMGCLVDLFCNKMQMNSWKLQIMLKS